MARRVFENQMRVYHLPEVADLSAPTETEITAGVDLTEQITADGIAIDFGNNTASIDLIAEGKIAQLPGTRSLQVNLTAVRDDDGDDFWDEFGYGEDGVLVISPFGEADTGAEVYVVKGAAQEPQPMASAANTFQQSMVEFPATDWDMKAEVAS